MIAADYVQLRVMADTMSRIGMNVEYVATDWGTMLQRRNKKEPIGRAAGAASSPAGLAPTT